MHFFYELAIFWSAKKRRKKTCFFSTLHSLSTVIFATATVLAFVLLRDSRFNFHCYTQCEATPTQKFARKCAATSCDFLRERLQSTFTLANQLRWIAQYKPSHHNITCSRLRNLIRSESWSCACLLSTTLLLLSTATWASWNSKCHCHQRKNKRPQPA